MNEFLVRSVFVLLIIIFYISGEFISNYLLQKHKIALELKYILPIVSLAYFEYWLRLFASCFFKFNLLKHVFNRSNLKLFLCIKNNSKFSGKFKITSIEGFKGIQPSITYENPKTKINEKSSLPENFDINLQENSNDYHFTLVCKFRVLPKPFFKIANLKFYFFKIKIKYNLNNVSKKKTFTIIKRRI